MRRPDGYSNTNSPTADYPYGSFKDETSAGANDGTPVQRDQFMDAHHPFLLLLQDLGISPSDTPEVATSNQILPAWKQLIYKRSSRETLTLDTGTDSYDIQDDDEYSNFVFDHSAGTGLKQGNLPTLAANQGKRYSFKNNGLGLTYINSEEGANILFKEYSLSKMIMIKSGDRLTLLATATGWLVEDYYMCIESGWYNRSDWTNVHVGFVNFDYDTKSGGTGDMTGEKYTLASGVTGLILNDSAPAGAAGTITAIYVTGTGLALNNEVGTCGSGQTFAVDEGTGDNKNQDWNITHNMAININAILNLRSYVNSSASWVSAYENMYSPTGANTYGITKTGVDTSNIKQHTATSGILIIDDTAAIIVVDTEDWYVNIIIEITA